MPNQRTSSRSRNAGRAFAVGFAVGRASEMVSVEVFAHQHLAHRNVELPRVFKRAARASLILSGMSPNRFASGHRIHHLEKQSRIKGILGSLRHMYHAGFGYDGDLDKVRDKLDFPGMNFQSDPLLEEKDGKLQYRDDPKIEKIIRRGGVYQFLPPLGALAILAGVRAIRNQENPVVTSAANVAGYITGLAARVGTTAYAEGRAGMEDGNFQTENLGLVLTPRITRHQDHHDRPSEIDSGSTGLHHAYYSVLAKAGVMDVSPHQD